MRTPYFLIITGLFFGILSTHVSALEPSSVLLPPDVARDAWFAPELITVLDEGYISRYVEFHPSEDATRGDFIHALVRPQMGEKIHVFQATFDDVPMNHPDFEAIEFAAANGIVRGAGNCVGSHPCYAYPESSLSRAEATQLLVRAFSLTPQSTQPNLIDVPQETWYYQAMEIAAMNCIIRGDGATGLMRPLGLLNRAEMIVMTGRALTKKIFPSCDIVENNQSSSVATNDTVISNDAMADIHNPGLLWSVPSGENHLSIPIDNTVTQATFVFIHEQTPNYMTLVSPEGTTITMQNAAEFGVDIQSIDTISTIFIVPEPQIGNWEMKMSSAGQSGFTPFFQSELQLQLSEDSESTQDTIGTPIQIIARFTDPSLVQSAHVFVRIGHASLEADIDTKLLSPGIPIPGDPKGPIQGRYYETSFTPQSSGTYCFEALAYGTTIENAQFVRQGSGWCTVVQ